MVTILNGRRGLAEVPERERAEPRLVTDGSELPRDVGHRLRVARRPDRSRSAVPARDCLESREVRPQALRSDRAFERRGPGRRRRVMLQSRATGSCSEQGPEPDRKSEMAHLSW